MLRVIHWEEKGLWNYDEQWLISFSGVEAQGEALDWKRPCLFEALVAQG